MSSPPSPAGTLVPSAARSILSPDEEIWYEGIQLREARTLTDEERGGLRRMAEDTCARITRRRNVRYGVLSSGLLIGVLLDLASWGD
jgi:hypothetical protein